MQPYSFAEASDGTLYFADGLHPVGRWDGYTPSFETAGLAIESPGIAVTLTGSGGGTINGTFYGFVSYIDRLGVESVLSAVPAPTVITNALTLTYGNLAVVAPPQAVKRRLWRTLDSAARVAYLDVEDSVMTTTTFDSTNDDAALATHTARPLLDSANLDITLNNAVPPDDKPILVWHLQRMYFLGSTSYQVGSVQTTNGSINLFGAGTNWTPNFVGRTVYVDGGDGAYLIDSVVDPGWITLRTAYTGTSAPYAAYSIDPVPAEANIMYYSLPGQPEYVPVRNGVELPEDNDVTTAAASISSFLYIFKRTRSYRFTVQSDPAKDGFIFPAADRGCVNNRCCVVIGSIAYVMDERGVYRFDGATATPVSGAIQDFFRGTGGMPIYWPAARFFHACNDPGRGIVRFFVCLRGDSLPRHALAYNYLLDRWDLETYSHPVGASTVGWVSQSSSSWRQNGEQVYLGGRSGDALFLGGAGGDGVLRGQAAPYRVASAGLCTVTVGPVAPPASLPVRCPVVVVDGDGRDQVRTVTHVTGNVLLLDRPWLVRPAAGDTVVIGGIPYRYRTRLFDTATTETEGERGARIEFLGRPGEKMYFKFRPDSGDWVESAADIDPADNFGVRVTKGEAEQEIDLGKVPPLARSRFDMHQEEFTDSSNRIDFELSGVSAETPHALSRLVFKGCR